MNEPSPNKEVRSIIPCALIIVVLLIAAVPLFAILTLDQGGTFNVSAWPADYDLDDDQDVLVVNIRNESEMTFFSGIALYLNHSGGSFTSLQFELAHHGAVPGDLDDDGDLDFAALAPFNLELALNQGGAQLGSPGDFKRFGNPIPPPDQNSMPASLDLGDLDGDGDLDAFLAGCCSLKAPNPLSSEVDSTAYSWIWLNQIGANGTLEQRTLSLKDLGILEMTAARLGDLDLDGDLDVFAVIHPSGKASDTQGVGMVLLNDGHAGFTDSGQRLKAGTSPFSTRFAGFGVRTPLALGDLDCDGDLDAALGTRGGVSLWLNQGGAQGGSPAVFSAIESLSIRRQTNFIHLADLDLDSDLDLLVQSDHHAQIFWNDGRLQDLRPGQALRITERLGFAIADFNGDALPDLFAEEYDAKYHLWLNTGSRTFLPSPLSSP